MNAVILYNEYKVGSQANAMLCEAAYRADSDLPWNISCWPMHMLIRWPVADNAVHEAADAHLIVIAARNQAELPPRLFRWLETWAEHRQVHDAALAVFDGRNDDLLSARPTPALAHFAERHGLCFIFSDMNPAGDKSAAFFDDSQQRGSPQTSTIADILEQVPGGNNRGWGHQRLSRIQS